MLRDLKRKRAHYVATLSRRQGAPLYPASGFEEYWLINVKGRVVEVYRGPQGEAWSSVTRHGRDEVISPLAFPDVQVRVGDVLR